MHFCNKVKIPQIAPTGYLADSTYQPVASEDWFCARGSPVLNAEVFPACSNKTYGENCAHHCGQCADSAVCDVSTGHCDRCEGNFAPPLCTGQWTGNKLRVA